MIEIRPEIPADRARIRELMIEAFTKSEFGHQGEADIYEALQKLASSRCWVAVSEDTVVGQITFSEAAICGAKDQVQGMALGPIAVDPTHQGKGIGRQLIEFGLSELDQSDTLFVIVAGEPTLYSKFDFVPAIRFGIRHGFKEMPQEVFFIRTSQPKRISSLGPGLAYYGPAFGPQNG